MIRLDYDATGLDIAAPRENIAGILKPPPSPRPAPPEKLMAKALASPMGTPPLRKLAQEKRSACVVLPDVTRPLPLQDVLPPVLEQIEQAGIAPEKILLLVATGLHRPTTDEELRAMVGAEIMGRYQIANHVASDASAHANLGKTSTGAPMCVDKRYCHAELKVVLGLVEPHFMAGFSGGRKLICPGIAAEETIRIFHGPELIGHGKSRNLQLEGNLVHETSRQVALKAGVDFSVNVVIDSERRLSGVFAGELDEAFLAATRATSELATMPVTERADIVIVSGGGYPLDATWYQTIKGIVAAAAAVKKGGTIISVAGMREGTGSAHFTALWERTEDLETFLNDIAAPGYYCADQWQLQELALAARDVQLMVFSHRLPASFLRKTFLKPLSCVEEGIEAALAAHGAKARMLVMPHGPYVLPVIGKPPAAKTTSPASPRRKARQ